ncbi:DNA polymerase III subunit beta [Dapis sp. BLCC M126]|uniref:DNA polymerase III subunit beta n=1 Tax=Dapis sp. BLCC M126 TaxID=3400189 RepID=UPI003CFA0E52
MKLTCTQSDLSSNLSLVSRAVPSRPNHPVLANVLLTADLENQRLELTGFDLSLGIRSSFPAVVETGGSLTLPAKLFNDIVSRLPDGNITIDDDEGEALAEPSGSYIATLTSTSGRYQVRGMGGEEYPELPSVEDGEVVNLPPEALINGLKGTLFATSPDETKQVLTGVNLKVQPDGLVFAATDGHRLAIVETESVTPEGEEETEEVGEIAEFEATIPAKALREIERMIGMGKSDSSVALKFDESQVIFELGEQRLTSRKLEGQYPAYQQLLPSKFTNQINVDRKQFLGAVERIAVLADQKNNILKCTIDNVNQEISLSVDAQDVGSGRESMAAQISSDEPEEIAFNVKYLIEGLKAIPSASEISIQLNTATTPVVLNPLGGLKMTYLIMPVQLRG